MFRQLLLCLLIFAGAAAAYVYYVPSAPETLLRFGITLPDYIPTASSAAAAQPEANSGGQGGQRPNGTAGGGQQAGGPGGGGGQRPGGGGRNQTLVVVTEPVGTGLINDSLTAIGEGVAAQSVSIAAAAGGTLVSVDVRPGDRVEAGAAIAHLNLQTEQIAYDQAQLALQDAQAALDRSNELSASVSAVALRAAALAVENAQLEVRAAELDLTERTINTPIGGTVGLLQVTPGNYVSAQTVITTVEDTSDILVNFWVPERYAAMLAPGLEVTVQAVALPGQTFSGTIGAVDNRIDTASRTLQVQARIPNETRQIRPGMSFSVSMRFPGQEFATVDPLSIQWSSEGAYVWKFLDGKVTRAMVEVIQRNSNGVLVEGEIAVGDAVVTQGVQQLQEGASVRLLDEPAVAENGQGGGERPQS